MSGYPSIPIALLQGLITAVIMLAPVLIYSFGGKLKTTASDVLLMLSTFPALGLVTFAVFFPFEGDWARDGMGTMDMLRPVLVGALALFIGMAFTQRKKLARRGTADAVARLGAAVVMGAALGLVWGLSGWLIDYFGIAGSA